MSVTLSLFAGAGAQFLDNNGLPLSGGQIYTYSAGTTTPLATFTTNLGTVAQANPIILNASGRIPVGELWLTTGYGYKFVVEDANGVLIGTYDNVPSSAQPPITNDASSISYELGYTVTAGSFIVGDTYLITSIGTTNFTLIGATSNTVGLHFIATGVGSGTGTAQLSRTVQSKLQEWVSIKDFGAVGDGTTDDTVAIQNAIDYAIQNNISLVRVPGPMNCIITNTLQLGYGVNNFTALILEGDSGSSYLQSSSRLTYKGTGDRPAINIQGGRNSGIRNLAIIRSSAAEDVVIARIQDMCYSINNIQRKATLSNWVEPGVNTTYSNAFCGVCIDGYSGSPASTYPTVSYPSWLGSGIPQYNKMNSSGIIVENCNIQGFYIGISQSPNNSGNGDYTRLTNTSIDFCAYAFFWNNQNSRLIDFTNTIVGVCYIGWTNKLALTGGAVGSTVINIVNSAVNEYGYQSFDLSVGAASVVMNCYAESLTCIGIFANGAATGAACTMMGCNFVFLRVGADGSIYVPPALMYFQGVIQSCGFDQLYGIEAIQNYGPSPNYIYLNNCWFNNHFSLGDYPTASAPESIGMSALGGIFIAGDTAIPQFTESFNFAYQYINQVVIAAGDSSRGSWVYSPASYWTGGSVNYQQPANKSGVTCSLNSIGITNNTLSAIVTVYDGNTPKVGDVIYYFTTPYILLVQSFDAGTGAIVCHICNDWQKDSLGNITALGTFSNGGGWSIVRQGKNLGWRGFAITTTSASNVITLTDSYNTLVADPTLYLSVGDTLIVCPSQYHPIMPKPPFVGFIVVTDITGSNITVNKNALTTTVFPATASLAK